MKSSNSKKIIFLTMILILVVSLAACAPKTKDDDITPTPKPTSVSTPTSTPGSAVTTSPAQGQTFTLAELAKFNGTKGEKAYIAVDGKVYDVTKHPMWKLGKHFGYKAGKDHSKTILTSPHGKSKLSDVPLVGTIK